MRAATKKLLRGVGSLEAERLLLEMGEVKRTRVAKILGVRVDELGDGEEVLGRLAGAGVFLSDEGAWEVMRVFGGRGRGIEGRLMIGGKSVKFSRRVGGGRKKV